VACTREPFVRKAAIDIGSTTDVSAHPKTSCIFTRLGYVLTRPLSRESPPSPSPLAVHVCGTAVSLVIDPARRPGSGEVTTAEANSTVIGQTNDGVRLGNSGMDCEMSLDVAVDAIGSERLRRGYNDAPSNIVVAKVPHRASTCDEHAHPTPWAITALSRLTCHCRSRRGGAQRWPSRYCDRLTRLCR
jgi:hypothetical protein